MPAHGLGRAGDDARRAWATAVAWAVSVVASPFVLIAAVAFGIGRVVDLGGAGTVLIASCLVAAGAHAVTHTRDQLRALRRDSLVRDVVARAAEQRSDTDGSRAERRARARGVVAVRVRVYDPQIVAVCDSDGGVVVDMLAGEALVDELTALVGPTATSRAGRPPAVALGPISFALDAQLARSATGEQVVTILRNAAGSAQAELSVLELCADLDGVVHAVELRSAGTTLTALR